MTSLDSLAALTASLPEGEPLGADVRALIEVALAASVTRLRGVAAAVARAREVGATAAQLEEVMMLVSGLGVHSLMVMAPLLAGPRAPLTPEQRALWNQRVGDDPYWASFEKQMPGFLDSLLRVSPRTFGAFFDWCALPWQGRAVSTRVKELISLAVDATPEHSFEPGFRLHLHNAIKLGIGRRAILEAVELAQAAEVT